MTIEAAVVAERLEAVRERIRAAGGDVARITVVAVTKGLGNAAVAAAAAAGLTTIGENYAQELHAKWSVFGTSLSWHLIGTVQRNKVALVAPAVTLWQAVDRMAAGRAIARSAPGAAVLVEVNTSGEPSKAGCTPAEAPALVEALVGLGLDVRGLMTVGPGGVGGPSAESRASFRQLRALGEQLGLRELSMGMSGDFDVAVQEGSTMVRVGTALFGPRPSGPPAPGFATPQGPRSGSPDLRR